VVDVDKKGQEKLHGIDERGDEDEKVDNCDTVIVAVRYNQ
jgi:hypothetical protein